MEELRADVDELGKLLTITTRPKVKDILELQVKKIQAEIVRRTEAEKRTVDSAKEHKKPKPTARYSKVINTYAWDQTGKSMKIYVSIDGVQNIDQNNISLEFTDRSFQLRVTDLNGVDYKMGIVNLFEDIVPAACYHKVKTDMVLVMLKKVKEGVTWAYVTQQEKKTKEAAKPKVEDSKDPNDSLMDMLKNMYDDGDDDMKRTIAKAWTESRNKSPDGQQGTL